MTLCVFPEFKLRDVNLPWRCVAKFQLMLFTTIQTHKCPRKGVLSMSVCDCSV